ncbi:MAG TPA: hypothetical protein VGM05_23910 [Planctomycetaceae bacterium]|jgi:hypothetical protein
MIVLPLLYVLSSGPLRTMAFHLEITNETTILSDGTEAVQCICSYDSGEWWPIAYAPLVWASDQVWGNSIEVYWHLFPIRAAHGEL